MSTSKYQVLLVEDELPIRRVIRLALERDNYEVLEAATVAQAREQTGVCLPDLLLVDWMLPDLPGTEFIKRLRQDKHTRDLPVIMLTARTEEDDMISGLDAGADDYLTKPVSLKHLRARIKALLRRSQTHTETDLRQLRAEGMVLDLYAHRLLIRGDTVHLGTTEYRLLEFLMNNPGRVFSRERLLDAVWGQNAFIGERTVDVHILRLRKALKKHGMAHVVETVRGAGYLFAAEVTRAE